MSAWPAHGGAEQVCRQDNLVPIETTKNKVDKILNELHVPLLTKNQSQWWRKGTWSDVYKYRAFGKDDPCGCRRFRSADLKQCILDPN